MSVEFIYPEFEVIRNTDRCITCRVCERQCANEVHTLNEEKSMMMADETSVSTVSVVYLSAPQEH